MHDPHGAPVEREWFADHPSVCSGHGGEFLIPDEADDE